MRGSGEGEGGEGAGQDWTKVHCKLLMPVRRRYLFIVIPAQAGIQALNRQGVKGAKEAPRRNRKPDFLGALGALALNSCAPVLDSRLCGIDGWKWRFTR